MATERLQKIIAAAGIASRRKAEEMISSGRVSLNGATVTELGTKADATVDHIRVDGKLLHGEQPHVYLVLNKPKGHVTTASDPEGRPTVLDLVRGIRTRVYPVGRLDYASEGLLLLTNDGELAQKLTHPSTHVEKIYVVKVSGIPTEDSLAKLRDGLRISMGDPAAGKPTRVRTAPANIRVVKEGANPWYEVTLTEGRNRQIRRMFEEVGHHVEKIRRVGYGPLRLDVPPGEFRTLREKEIRQLRDASRTRRGTPPAKMPASRDATADAMVIAVERRPATKVARRKGGSAEQAQRRGKRFPPKRSRPEAPTRGGNRHGKNKER